MLNRIRQVIGIIQSLPSISFKNPKSYNLMKRSNFEKILHIRNLEERITLQKLFPRIPLFATNNYADMDFYFRKLLTANGIKYTYYQKMNTLVTNHPDCDFPNLRFKFDSEMFYVTVDFIPARDCQYVISYTEISCFIQKLAGYRIVPVNIVKRIKFDKKRRYSMKRK